jgi:hypothetical protein
LNSTPELTWMFLLVRCSLALKVSYEHSVNDRDKKGAVRRMNGMPVSLGGRSASSLAAAYSTFVGCVELNGGGRVEPSIPSPMQGKESCRSKALTGSQGVHQDRHAGATDGSDGTARH